MFSEEKIKSAFKDLDQKNAKALNDLIIGRGISKTRLPEKGGVYIFWWNQSKAFEEKLKGCTYQVKAKKSHEVDKINIKFTQDWIEKATVGNKVCLYVGKTTNLRDRVTKHLKLTKENIWVGHTRNSGKKPNTVSQMRIGLETVFDKDMLVEIKENVSVSWAVMDEYSEAVNRFFLEDKMISNNYPLFNIDVER
ncbi:hypothetical protein LDL76_00750 [Salegentibacter mishustinae]|uniref:hypothetical protein n=1 Tax=Salegentibacter mishustinae TaxID=270918 RepID=UPI001CE0F899|nr:hypothetical protein [Salegentibacter mishustinae]UBZ07255.1 hypothetical protein LDL76_00750 [Salegentibacter mishustinae]